MQMILVLVFLLFCNNALSCHVDDREALLEFKRKLTIQESSSISSWKGMECCNENWMGVICNPQRRVVSLALSSSSDSQRPDTTGTLAESLGKLPLLESLVITGMKGITGSIPTAICNLTHLSHLILEDNSLSGFIPSCLGGLVSLQAFSVAGNRLAGETPASLGNLRSLQTISLARNRFSGSIPLTYKNLNLLQFLDLSQNFLSGSIPDFVGMFTNLTSIDLSSNNLSGPIPGSVCNLANLMDLSFALNQLTGTIPNCIGRLKNLATLSIAFNRISGPIPESVSVLPKLWSLNLSSNSLSESIPAVPSILSLDLSRNSFNFDGLPRWIAGRDLVDLRLAGCNLRGALPRFLRPGSLTSLDLSDNHFTSWLPDFLTNMTSLQKLNLYNNQLKFDISKVAFPDQITILDLHSNSISGSLTNLFTSRRIGFLEFLDISRNMISGVIPELKEGLSFRAMNLASNRISGSIPSSIANLTKLEKLDLSRNKISGSIPASFGDLEALKWFDLSINNLSGEIPATLLNLKLLRHANFRSNSLCKGIPRGRPFNVFRPSAYAHNPCLCGKPLQPCGGKNE